MFVFAHRLSEQPLSSTLPFDPWLQTQTELKCLQPWAALSGLYTPGCSWKCKLGPSLEREGSGWGWHSRCSEPAGLRTQAGKELARLGGLCQLWQCCQMPPCAHSWASRCPLGAHPWVPGPGPSSSAHFDSAGPGGTISATFLPSIQGAQSPSRGLPLTSRCL